MNTRATILIVLSCLLMAAGAIVVVWRRNTQPPTADFSQAVFEPRAVTLSLGVHLLGELSPGAAYVVETSAGLALVDTGLDADAQSVVRQMNDLGLKLADLKMILITHVHGDHSLGARRLSQMTGAKIYAGEGDAREIESGGPREAFFSTFHMPQAAAHATPLDVRLAGGETIPLGDAKFLAIATPGHTPGSLCFLLEQHGLRILFTGDTISSLSDGLGTYAAHLSSRYRSSADEYLASLIELRATPVPDLVLPGHPRLDRAGQSPRMSEQDWHKLLDRGIDEMKTVIARYERDGRDFLDGTPKEILPGLFYLGQHASWAMYCVVTESGTLLFDAPGEQGLNEFVRAQFKTLGIQTESITAVLLTSCAGESIAGLSQLVAEFKCRVVAPSRAIEQLRPLLPTDSQFVAVEELGENNWLPAKAIEVAGLGVSPVCYELEWRDKSVLITGRIPRKITEESVMTLARELTADGSDAVAYLASINTLGKLRPDVWLPAIPLQDQNANLYESQWHDMIDDHRAILGGSR